MTTWPSVRTYCFTAGIFNLDTTLKGFSHRFTAQESKTVDKIYLLTALVGTSPTYRVGLQGDDEGDPDGSWLGGTAYADVQFINGWLEIDITNAALTQGTVYHIVAMYQSGTIDGSNYGRMKYGKLSGGDYIPYDLTLDSNYDTRSTDDGGTTWDNVYWHPLFLLEYTDATYLGQPNDNYTWGDVWGAKNYGEEFTVPENKLVSHIGFYMYKIGNPTGPLQVSIYNKTDAEYLLDHEEWTEIVSETGAWYDHAFLSQQTLVSGKVYQVFLSCPNGDGSNYYAVRITRTTGTPPTNSENWMGIQDRYAYANSVPLTPENNRDICFSFTIGTPSVSIPAIMKHYRSMRT